MTFYVWAIIIFLFSLNVVQFWYFTMRTHELHIDHLETVQGLNQDLIDERQMMRDVEIQARVLGSVPVSRLIGDNDE